MSLWQAWNRSTIVNKIGAICGIAGLLVSLGSMTFNYLQLRAAARVNHEQRLLEWNRLKFEDDSAMPDFTPMIPICQPENDRSNACMQLINLGPGATRELHLVDTITSKELLSSTVELPHGGELSARLPTANIDRKHLMKLVFTSPHGSTRTKTFYFSAAGGYIPVSDKIDRTFDFLITDEPGRMNGPR